MLRDLKLLIRTHRARVLAVVQARWHVIAAALVVIAALFGVAELSDDVMEGDTQAFDEKVLQALRQSDNPAMPIGPDWLHQAATDITALGSHTVLILVSVLALVFCLFIRRYDVLRFLLFSSLGALMLNTGLKNLFVRERPNVVDHLVEVSTYSYPSGHALMTAAIYLSFAAILAETVAGRWTRSYIVAVALLAAGLVGLSRIYLGVHYPSDILAGWAVGCAWALLCWLGVVWLKGRKKGLPSSRR